MDNFIYTVRLFFWLVLVTPICSLLFCKSAAAECVRLCFPCVIAVIAATAVEFRIYAGRRYIVCCETLMYCCSSTCFLACCHRQQDVLWAFSQHSEMYKQIIKYLRWTCEWWCFAGLSFNSDKTAWTREFFQQKHNEHSAYTSLDFGKTITTRKKIRFYLNRFPYDIQVVHIDF